MRFRALGLGLGFREQGAFVWPAAYIVFRGCVEPELFFALSPWTFFLEQFRVQGLGARMLRVLSVCLRCVLGLRLANVASTCHKP